MTYDSNDFFPRVWDAVRQVPYGAVTTYGQIASMFAPPPGVAEADFKRLGPKWVGEALNAVSFRDIDGRPLAHIVPWWRVINAQGGISMPAGGKAAAEQRARLEAEGVVFDDKARVDLNAYGWHGPNADWLAANGLSAPRPIRKDTPPPDAPPTQPTLF